MCIYLAYPYIFMYIWKMEALNLLLREKLLLLLFVMLHIATATAHADFCHFAIGVLNNNFSWVASEECVGNSLWKIHRIEI